MHQLADDIRACRLCAPRFAQTRTQHRPRPVAWFGPKARILIAGQAPGARVHDSGIPFDDRSGERLRSWLGLTAEEFYDTARIAIVPMAFCFPGYDARGADLPPPRICCQTWHDRVMAELGHVRLTLAIGAHAQRYHLSARGTVTETVRAWRDHAPHAFPLPHPSWRNTGLLKKNPWFEAELLPQLRRAVRNVFDEQLDQ